MPIFDYVCASCGFQFEEIVSYDNRDKVQSCQMCGSESKRKEAHRFGVHTTLTPGKDTVYSSKEIDKVVGRESELKWAGYNEKWKDKYNSRKHKRIGDRKYDIVDIPKGSDGAYHPAMHMGTEKDRSLRKEFSEALQVHREERKKKGLEQFDSKGAIQE